METHAFATGKYDEWLFRNFLPSKRPCAFRERMSRRQHGDERLPPEKHRLQPGGGLCDDRTGEPDGEPSARDHFPDALGSALLEDYGHARKTKPELREQPAEKRLRRCADVAHAQLALLARGSPLHATHGFIDTLKQQPDFVQQNRPRFRECDASPIPQH